jgi:hypothetical protein
MRDPERLTRPVAVSLPAEIHIANAEHVSEQLRAAFAPGVTAVTAEMGLTVFCCTSGGRQLLAAHKRAMSWLTNPEPGIGDCCRPNHVRQRAEAHCRASRRPVLAASR